MCLEVKKAKGRIVSVLVTSSDFASAVLQAGVLITAPEWQAQARRDDNKPVTWPVAIFIEYKEWHKKNRLGLIFPD